MEDLLSRIVIDANLAVALVVSLPYSERAIALMDSWRISRTALYIPALAVGLPLSNSAVRSRNKLAIRLSSQLC